MPLGKLKTLDVSGTKVDEEVGRFLGRLKGLERIYLGNTRVTGELLFRWYIFFGALSFEKVFDFCLLMNLTHWISSSYHCLRYLTEVSVRQLVTCCLNLTVMDLNGCRGIPLRIRKTLFEDVWREVHGRG